LAERPKPSYWGSVLGTPLEMEARSDGGRWWGGSYKAMMVVGWCVCKLQGGGGVGAKNSKPSVCGSISGAPWETAV